MNQSNNAALIIYQQAILVLAKWIDENLLSSNYLTEDIEATQQAKKLLFWSEEGEIKPLRVLFDQVILNDKNPRKEHYWEAKVLEDENPTIPYPRERMPLDTELAELKQEIKAELARLGERDWNNLTILTIIIEKYGSYLSFVESDVALVDITRSTAAVASALASHNEVSELSLIAGDLSGIQNFIYTISSDGALKSLRARSFYLELVTEEVVQQLLDTLNLPRTNVIYAGGGNLYVLTAASQENKEKIVKVRDRLNRWLLDQFKGKVFLALDKIDFNREDIATPNFAKYWSEVTKGLAKQKAQKFVNQIGSILTAKPTHEPCKVCHRDDVKYLKPLNSQEPDSVLACGTCRRMYSLGGQLFNIKAIVRSPSDKNFSGYRDKLNFGKVNYYLVEHWSENNIVADDQTVFLVNNWTINHYRHNNTVSLLLGNYGKRTEDETGFMAAGEMVKKATGIKRVGYLRMDVDRLGQIFAKGLGEKQTLPRLAGLSRQMSYFFKVYLNSLAEFRQKNLLDKVANVQSLTDKDRPNLLFIYAGGDDLFVSGTWNEVVEFGFDVYQSFRAYTGYNPDITLSGGISLGGAKFPLYQAASESGEAEEAAKGNGRDSLGLFGEVFKWNEWLGSDSLNSTYSEEMRQYFTSETQPALLGIFPFVKSLEENLTVDYSRNFVRNLLTTAQIQEQMIKKAKDKQEKRDIRYFLHLPKVAYTIARLPSQVRNQPEFEPVRTSLKSPYNAPYFRAIAMWIELLNRN